MRLLIYGGCHATVLAGLLRRYAADAGLRVESLLNYAMIARGEPFPLDALGGFDAVVYSPIVNQGAWNTEHLQAACDAAGIPTLRFPWLEWRGYFPGVAKRQAGTGGVFGDWAYPGLFEAARGYASFADFVAAACDGDLLAADAGKQLRTATALLKGGEDRHAVDIRITPLIARRYKATRLFLTPDHPSREVYFWLVQEIARLLEIRLDRSFAYASEQPQETPRLPVLPSVARALDLRFKDASARDEAFGAGRWLSLREYLSPYYHAVPGAVLYRATAPTFLKRDTSLAASLAEADRLALPAGTELIAEPLAPPADGHQQVRVVWQDGAGVVPRDWYLYHGHWVAPSLAAAPSDQ